MDTQGLSFGSAADLYDSVRPSYPVEAVFWALGSQPRQVADVGAGTGIFTRLLVELGHRVVAVEPDPQMRAKLNERSPEIEAVAGSAESIPFVTESLDAVTAAQAHHWFDHDAAHAEIARVLRPDGVFVAIWNIRDESVPWVAELTKLLDFGDVSSPGDESDTPRFGPLFDEPELGEFPHSTTHDAESLIALVHSRSYYLVASVSERRRVDDGVRALAGRLPERFELPYVTRVFKAKRLS